MLKQIDHVVILVRELDAAVQGYEAAGFAVTPGGEHASGDTHNALVGFGDGTYLELIAFHDPEQEHPHRWWRRLAKGEGLIDYALLSDDLAAEAKGLRERDVDAPDPQEGGRIRPDAKRIGWRNLHLTSGPARMGLPFLIEDTTPRDLRVPSGSAAEHKLGVTRAAGLTLVVTDLKAASRRLGAVLNDEGQPSPAGEDGEGRRFRVGEQWLQLIQPASSSTERGKHLQTFGDSPYELILSTGPAEPGSGDLLPLDQTHGARIRTAR